MTTLTRHCEVIRSGRVRQLEGMFDVPPHERDERTFTVALDHEAQPWHIGLIVGPSGSGKTTIISELFGQPARPAWPDEHSVLDGFPEGMSIRDITSALSAVGFSSPPAWCRPYRTLSTGEQFRADVARVLAEAGGDLGVIDEFTSVVDRTVAQIASAAVAKYARRSDRKLVCASCHYDIIDWLQPDWVYDTRTQHFEWRSVQPRPPVEISISRCSRAVWPAFAPHHYLSSDLATPARCWLGEIDGRWAAFSSVIHHLVKQNDRAASGQVYREHRTVVLPDYQGIGVGNAMSETVGAIIRAHRARFRSTTTHPAMIRHRARSPLWKMVRTSSNTASQSTKVRDRGTWGLSRERWTSSFEYVGPSAPASWIEDVGLAA